MSGVDREPQRQSENISAQMCFKYVFNQIDLRQYVVGYDYE